MQNTDKGHRGQKEVNWGKDKLPKWQAILQCKCPRCTQGDMFKTGALNIKKFNELKEQCAVCGLRFQVEPGFYQLSMYFTYAVSIAIIFVFGLGAYLTFEDPPLWVIYVAIFTPLVLTTPWNVRYSKVIMLYVFGGVWEPEK
jgi:uncharacterized protein (DUF983 family)